MLRRESTGDIDSMRLSLALGIAPVFLLLAAEAQAEETVLLQAIRDASIYAESGTQANGMGDGIFTGETNNTFVRRGMIAFNVAGAIPPASEILSVQLRMQVTRVNGPPLNVGLHRVLANWGEGMSMPSDGNGGQGTAAVMGDTTWLHRFYDTQTWATPGGDFSPMVSGVALAGDIDTLTTWSTPGMVTDVQAWLDTPAQNFGWMLVAQTVGAGQARRFASREFADAALRPVLEVTFEPAGPTGACCVADGTCTTALDPGDGCTGTYQGTGTTCGTVSCPQPAGACCIADADATCISLTALDCEAQSGTWQGAFVGCATNLCPVVPTPFLDPLPIPRVADPIVGMPGEQASYDISFVQFEQQLHSELPPTTVWGFDDGAGPTYPGPTIEALANEQVDVNWINDFRDSNGQFLQTHALPVDLCSHGAMDEARAVMHLHGAHVAAAYDGQPMLTILPGESSVYEYPNNQHGATLWYHDHSLGTTRLGVQMGLAGFYLLRNPGDAALNLPSGNYEIPMAIQDRSFNVDGSFRYPAALEEHVVGNTILVNGKVWPFLNVDRGKYRFRWLNGSGSRAYRLKLSNGAGFSQIGSDGGFLAAPVPVSEVLMLPGERMDVVIDFAAYPPGTIIDLINDAPAVYPGAMTMDDVPNVLRFIVQPAMGHTAPLPAFLEPVELPTEQDSVMTRTFEMSRMASPCASGMWTINGLGYDTITEEPQLGTSEIWRFVNKSGLAHPMHIHLVMFRVLDRQPFTLVNGQVQTVGPAVPPIPTEAGYKDTVRVEPNEIVRVVATFENYVGNYAYHCHILEHEDNEMMRQFTTQTTCGDGALGMPDELCDDGNFDLQDSCPDGIDEGCQPARCGDGFRWNTDGGTEECDEGGETQFCDANCTQVFCGDGDLNVLAGEQCDDSNTDPGDGCSPLCQTEAVESGGGGAGGGTAEGGGVSSGGTGGTGAAGGAGGSGGGDIPVPEGCACSTPSRSGEDRASLLALAIAVAAYGTRRRLARLAS